MASSDDSLPEGTDTIIEGAAGESEDSASRSTESGGSPRERLHAEASSLRDKAAEAASGLKEDAANRLRDVAHQGRDRAADALDNLSRLVSDAAGQIDDAIGGSYGEYARTAADSVSGVAAGIREKEIEDLLEDARDFVRRSPAIAIGIAAAAGFLIARVVKAGSTTLEGAAQALESKTAEGAASKRNA